MAKKPQPHPPVSINLYRNLAVGFASIVGISIMAVFLLTLARVNIIVVPNDELLNLDLMLDLGGEDSAARGSISEIIETKESRGQILGGAKSPVPAQGRVIIYNNRPIAQTLIATTRLLSPDGALFRLKNRVVVPAKGQISADVYADKAGREGEIAPTAFTIPGLPSELQKFVYAESREPMSGGEVALDVITQDDVARAAAALKDELQMIGEVKLEERLSSLELADAKYVYTSEILEQSTDALVGKKASAFNVKETLHIVGAVFSGGDILEKVKENLADLTPANRTLLPLQFQNLKILIDDFDVKAGTAKLKVSVAGQMRLSSAASELAKDRFFGLTKEGAENYLSNLDGIGKFEIKMPFYLTKIPKDEGRVKISVK